MAYSYWLDRNRVIDYGESNEMHWISISDT